MLVFLASKVLTDPIKHMLEVIRKVKRGRLEERMEVETADELGELARAFNVMATELQAAYNDLQQRLGGEVAGPLAQRGRRSGITLSR